MSGYNNRILRVNLSQRTLTEEPLSDELINDYIGGRGFGIKLLYDDLKAGTDPLGAGNELIFVAGPLAGTKAQSFSRYKVFFKSPLTYSKAALIVKIPSFFSTLKTDQRSFPVLFIRIKFAHAINMQSILVC